MLWWLSVAPFGKPVVPEVNWMLIASSNCRVGPISARRRRRRRSLATVFSPCGKRYAAAVRLSSPMVITSRSPGSRVACRAPGRADESSGARSREHAPGISLVFLVTVAITRARQPTLFEAGVLGLTQTVGRIDVHLDDAGLGGGELGHHPFGAVGSPDADVVARLAAPARSRPAAKRRRRAFSARHRSSGFADGARSAPSGRDAPRRSRRSSSAPMARPNSGLALTALT